MHEKATFLRSAVGRNVAVVHRATCRCLTIDIHQDPSMRRLSLAKSVMPHGNATKAFRRWSSALLFEGAIAATRVTYASMSRQTAVELRCLRFILCKFE